MTDFENLEQHNSEPVDESDDIRISDLPPETRSHYLLLRLVNTRERLRTFSRQAGHALQRVTHVHHVASSTEHDETELEMRDLPPGTRNHYLLLALQTLKKRLRAVLSSYKQSSNASARPALTRTQRHARIGRALTALGLCATLLLLLVGNTPTLRARLVSLFEPARPTSTTIAYSSSISQGSVPITIAHPDDPYATAIPAGGPGPLPATCPRASTLQYFLTTLDPPGLGSGPLWLSGFNGPIASLIHLQPGIQSLGVVSGWYQPLTVFMQKGFVGTFVLHGASQGGMGYVEFSYGGSMNFAPALILSLDNPAGVHFTANGDWEMTTINIMVPKAGCYALQTTWSNSTWTEYFAAGS